MTDWYGIAKDFAGPIATTLAAGAAATITYRFARVQAAIARSQRDIAQSQRDIAYDKLKSDLFARRYEIYSTAGELIDFILSSTPERPTGGPDMMAKLRKIDEARFFFPYEQAQVFGNIGKLVEAHEVHLSQRTLHQNNETLRIAAGDNASLAWTALKELRFRLPELMQSELGFSQLRGSSWNEAAQ
jgi:hypothetical protein